MDQRLLIALQLTAIGMGLVFAAILLLWGLMALLVRLTADKEGEPAGSPEEERRLAASVAVAVALAQAAEETPNVMPLPPTALVSAWQAVMRTSILNKRGAVR
jgi:Na+-transporting methylmalonyl-CoA/oxaloacetate decarboxylase gamma subunit